MFRLNHWSTALSLLLAHLLKKNPGSRPGLLRLLSALPLKADDANHPAGLGETLEASRIEAEVNVFLTDDPGFEIAKRTGETAVMLSEFTPPGEGVGAQLLEEMNGLMGVPIDMIFVHNTGDVELEA